MRVDESVPVFKDSPPICVRPPEDKLSRNACLTIGRSCRAIHWTEPASRSWSFKKRERGRVSTRKFHLLTDIMTSFKRCLGGVQGCHILYCEYRNPTTFADVSRYLLLHFLLRLCVCFARIASPPAISVVRVTNKHVANNIVVNQECVTIGLV